MNGPITKTHRLTGLALIRAVVDEDIGALRAMWPSGEDAALVFMHVLSLAASGVIDDADRLGVAPGDILDTWVKNAIAETDDGTAEASQ